MDLGMLGRTEMLCLFIAVAGMTIRVCSAVPVTGLTADNGAGCRGEACAKANTGGREMAQADGLVTAGGGTTEDTTAMVAWLGTVISCSLPSGSRIIC